MAKWISFITGTYILVCICFLLPISIYIAWDLAFLPSVNRVEATSNLIRMLIFVVVGYPVMRFLLHRRTAKLTSAIKNVAPPDYKATVEIIGPHETEYFGMSPSSNKLVIVDLKRKVARCEDYSFLQTWKIEDIDSRSILTISFNDYDFSTLKIVVPQGHRDSIAARLNLAGNS